MRDFIVNVYVFERMRACVFACVSMSVSVRVCVYAYVRVCACVCVCVRA